MKKDWTAYRKASNELCRAVGRRAGEFDELFKANDEVKYRRKHGGKVHVGRILKVCSFTLRLRVANIETDAEYWVDAHWLTEDE